MKIPKNNFFRDCCKLIALVQHRRPTMLPVVLLTAVLESAFPFVNIIFGALILDCLIKGDESVMVLVWWMIGLNFALGCSSRVLRWICRAEALTADQLALGAMTEKCMTMDYQQLETQEIMDKKARAEEGCTNQGSFFEFVWNLSELLCHGLTVLYALITVSRLFVSSSLPADANIWVQALNSPWMALAAVVLALAVPLGCVPLTRWANRVSLEWYNINVDGNRRGAALSRIVEDYRQGKDQRTYRISDMLMDKYERVMDVFCKHAKTFGLRTQAIQSLVMVVNLNTVLIAYLFTGMKAMAGLITVGMVFMQVEAITALAGAVREAVAMVGCLDLQRKYLNEYVDFLAIPSEKYNGTLPVEKRDDGDFDLEFRDVSFRYPNQEQWSLRHVSCRLPKGRKLAIVGPNGAGKTTFIKLLCRLYDPTEGEILLNGIDIRKYDYGEYLSLLSVVFQDFRMFSMKLGENVAASVHYDPQRVWECLDKAGLRQRVEGMREGLETGLYQQKENGVEISGGEGQKLAIARALYKDAPVVILDEPTAALDPVSEYDIYNRFGQMVEGKTSVYISHRMSSCRFCDLVFVFDGGTITQRGTHEELLAQKEGLYAQLWQAQALYYGESQELQFLT
ncbi:MAG: ABC transporter ATP-binding protein/permease [Lachnospiraceae bacterium]|nr:ABC transporter ATP-binding protein/permease [Lachnospiraceae bacterium]